MKKIISLVFIFTTVFLLAGCNSEFATHVELEGFDDVKQHLSSLGMTEYLLPFKDTGKPLEFSFDDVRDVYGFEEFSVDFPSISKNAYYYLDEPDISKWETEFVLLYFKYDDEAYIKTKEYAFSHMFFTKEPYAEYKNYTFYLNHAHDFESDNLKKPPILINLFGFSDESQTLVFLGSFCFASEGGENLFENNFQAYLDLWFTSKFAFD